MIQTKVEKHLARCKAVFGSLNDNEVDSDGGRKL